MNVPFLIADSSAFPTPDKLLLYVLLGLILGAAGQGVRAIVGWKQLHDQAANTGTPIDDLFQLRTLIFSFGVGAVAGICAALGLLASKTDWDMRSILGLMAAGYAGADFIEGFAGQYLPKSVAEGSAADAKAGAKKQDNGLPNDDPNASAAAEEDLPSAAQG